MNRTAIYAVVGVACTAVGIAAMAAPGLAGGVSTNETGVLTIGFVAAVMGLRMAIDRLRRSRDVAAIEAVESTQRLLAPGESFDEHLERSGDLGRHDLQKVRSSIENRLERIGVATLVRREGCPREVARQRLYDGEWTDDPHAAAFFRFGGDRRAELRAAIERRSLDPLRSRFRFQARRFAAEIVRLSEDDRR